MFKQKEILEQIAGLKVSIDMLSHEHSAQYDRQVLVESHCLYLMEKMNEFFTKYLDDFIGEEKIKELVKEAMNEYRKEMEIPKKVSKKK